MCKAPKPPKPKDPDKPEFLRNPYLDAAVGRAGQVNQLRSGRSSLRIPLGSGLAIQSPTSTPTRTPSTRTPAAPPGFSADAALPGIRGIRGRRLL